MNLSCHPSFQTHVKNIHLWPRSLVLTQVKFSPSRIGTSFLVGCKDTQQKSTFLSHPWTVGCTQNRCVQPHVQTLLKRGIPCLATFPLPSGCCANMGGHHPEPFRGEQHLRAGERHDGGSLGRWLRSWHDFTDYLGLHGYARRK